MIQRGLWVCIVHQSAAEEIAEALTKESMGERVNLGGRGELREIPAPDRFRAAVQQHSNTILIRKFRRGGALRHFRRDAFFLQNRAKDEFEVHVFLQEQRLPVAPLAGAAWRAILPGYYEGAIATPRLDARPLRESLEPSNAEKVMKQCGHLVRRLHDLCVDHPDLQLDNFLWRGEEIYVLDFDKARRHPSLGDAARWSNLLRLRRSLEKHGYPLEYFNWLLEGYGEGSAPRWLDRVYSIKGKTSDWMTGRRR